MTMVINGSGTITGLTAGGLPDATIVQADLASGVAGNGPAFSAYGPGQSITTATLTKLVFSTKEYDTANCYDTSNYRFTPNVAGYYTVKGALAFQTVAANSLITVYKNGSRFKDGLATSSTANTNQGSNVCVDVYLNGTTDYIELYAYQASGSSLNTNSTSYTMYFQASMVRAA